MKVYRVVPNCFFTGKKLDNSGKISLESLYYKMGYTSFSSKVKRDDYNSLNCKNYQGKFFYLFAEDAVFEGSSLINGYHRLRANICSILEYDIPEDMIIKHIGYGDYTYDIMPLFLIETFLEKDDFGSVILSNEIAEDKKLKCLVETLKDSLRIAEEYDSFEDKNYYKDLFQGFNLSSLTDEEIMHVLLSKGFYSTFSNQQCELISSPFITGRIIPLSMVFLSDKLGNFNEISEYYQKLGIRYEFSKEHQNFKKELLNTIRYDSSDKENIKRLLKEKKYI